MDRTPALPEKQIVVEFGGGDADGLVLDSVTADEAQLLMIRAVWRMTRGGEVGRAFRGISLEGFRRLGRQAAEAAAGLPARREYVVASRDETDDRVRIAVRYTTVAASDAAPPERAARPVAALTYEMQIADEMGLPFNEHCFLYSDDPIPTPAEGDIVTVQGMGDLRVGWRHFVFDTRADAPSLRIVVKCSPVD